MRKILSIVMICSTIFVLGACGKKAENDTTPTTPPTLAPTTEPTAEPTPEPTKEPVAEAGNALSVLQNVWSTYSEDEQFPATGGDFENGNNVMGEPGKYDISDPEALFSVFGFPKDQTDAIDDAASLLHMMNANTFTSGAFHVTDPANVATLAAAIKENVSTRQWLCGFPDKLVIIGNSEYVVSAFGEQSLIANFQSKVLETLASAEVLYEVNLMD